MDHPMKYTALLALALVWPLSLLIVYQIGAETGRDDALTGWTFHTITPEEIGLKVDCAGKS